MLCLAGLLVLGIGSMSAQGYDEEKQAMTNFIVRMYKNAPFEGVKVFTDYENSYLLSILSLDQGKYPNASAMNRVAGVKAMSQASRYFNGSDITSDLIIHSVERADGTGDSEIIENPYILYEQFRFLLRRRVAGSEGLFCFYELVFCFRIHTVSEISCQYP